MPRDPRLIWSWRRWDAAGGNDPRAKGRVGRRTGPCRQGEYEEKEQPGPQGSVGVASRAGILAGAGKLRREQVWKESKGLRLDPEGMGSHGFEGNDLSVVQGHPPRQGS